MIRTKSLQIMWANKCLLLQKVVTWNSTSQLTFHRFLLLMKQPSKLPTIPLGNPIPMIWAKFHECIISNLWPISMCLECCINKIFVLFQHVDWEIRVILPNLKQNVHRSVTSWINNFTKLGEFTVPELSKFLNLIFESLILPCAMGCTIVQCSISQSGFPRVSWGEDKGSVKK